jgi:hypothetical protein
VKVKDELKIQFDLGMRAEWTRTSHPTTLMTKPDISGIAPFFIVRMSLPRCFIATVSGSTSRSRAQ